MQNCTTCCEETEQFVTVPVAEPANVSRGIDHTKDLYERLLAEKERIIKEKDAHIEDLRKMLFIVDKKIA